MKQSSCVLSLPAPGLSKSSPRKGIFQKFKSPDLALSQSVVGGVNAKNVTCQYVLIFSVALAALIAVWGVVIAVIIFWALPGDPPKDQDQSQVSNTSTSVKDNNIGEVKWGNNKTCHRLMKMDPFTNSCYIPCIDWDWQTETETQVALFAKYTTTVVTSVCLILTIISWIKLKHLWNFPLITPFYALLARSASGLIRSVPYIFAKKLFCSDKDLLVSVKKPTTFCSITGPVRHYLTFVGILWYMFSFANLWWIVVFPTKGKLLFDQRRRIHIMQLFAALGSPILLVVAVYAAHGQYSQQITFPYDCYPSSKIFYYTWILPVQIVPSISCTLLISTCYSLAKQVITYCPWSTLPFICMFTVN
jgi:hypothetical protein